ncbi:MAG: RNA polymerase factor sigma-32 [Smithella sp.]|nr:RNA polymerase factor sigma-32 [Smithella sp.]OQC72739.1 MAG: RNA polymerase sigma factor RpoH [Deltaproteobacteria bacterium ADurb.Bin002]HQJ77397.1 RNA polymerase factor sigma-32 [Smithellaceae bacterium]
MKLPIFTGTLDLYIAEINRFPILTPEEEFKLAMRLKKDNDMEAAEKLIVSNLRFVVKIAHEYRSYGFKLADLIQEGNIGLIHAVKKFDPEKGYRLISYAVWWIRAYIQNYLIKSWSIVKIGTTQAQRKLFFKLNQARKQLETISKKNPEFSEIADSLGVKGSEVAEMDLRMGARDLSLNKLIGDDGETSHLDFLTHDGDNQETSVIKDYERELVEHNIGGALATLNERERYIIQHRIMLNNTMEIERIVNEEQNKKVESNDEKERSRFDRIRAYKQLVEEGKGDDINQINKIAQKGETVTSAKEAIQAEEAILRKAKEDIIEFKRAIRSSDREENIAKTLQEIGDRYNIPRELVRQIREQALKEDIAKTLQEIGDKYNITRERARQIEKQALKKVQLALPHLKEDH